MLKDDEVYILIPRSELIGLTTSCFARSKIFSWQIFDRAASQQRAKYNFGANLLRLYGKCHVSGKIINLGVDTNESNILAEQSKKRVLK